MKRISQQHAASVAVALVATTAAIVTIMLVAGLWSGSQITSRMTAVSLRLNPPAEDTKPDQDPEASGAQPNGNSQNGAENQKKEEPKPVPSALAVARINAKNMFFVPQKPEFRNILGILGNRVLYPGGISLKVGDTHNGATVKEIGSNWVIVEYEGEIIPLGVYGGKPPPKPEPENDKESEAQSEAITDKGEAESPEGDSKTDDTHTRDAAAMMPPGIEGEMVGSDGDIVEYRGKAEPPKVDSTTDDTHNH